MKLYCVALALTVAMPALAMEKTKQIEVPVANARALEAFKNGKVREFLECVDRGTNFAGWMKLDINYQYPQEDNKTLLAYVCQLNPGMNPIGYQACLRALLDKQEIDVNRGSLTPLHCAVCNPDTTALQFLMEYKNRCKLDFNNKGAPNGATPLQMAATLGMAAQLKILLKEPSVNPNVFSKDPLSGGCPLHRTIKGQCIGYGSEILGGLDELVMMRDLVECGAQVECKIVSKTPVNLFVNTGEGLINVSLDDKTPLQLALANCKGRVLGSSLGYERILGLLACGAAITHKEFDWFLPQVLPVNYLTVFDSLESSAFLGVCCEAAVKGTLLEHSAAKFGEGSTFENELKHINAQDTVLQMTPFMWAAARGNLPLAQQLVSLGADVTKKDRFGYTALHFAVLNEHPEMAKYILSVNPDTRIIKNGNLRTPIDIVIRAKKSNAILAALELPGDKKYKK